MIRLKSLGIYALFFCLSLYYTNCFICSLSTVITAISNFSIQYNFQSISVALLIMTASVCSTSQDKCKQGEQASWVNGTANAAVFAGAICGQLTMGYAGDILGRNKALALTLGIVVFSAMMSSATPSGSAGSIYSTIIIFRFLLGVGAGGLYPLSAAKASEDSSKYGSTSDSKVSAAWAFFWQTPGAATPWLIGYLLPSTVPIDQQWRLILGLGAIPSCFVLLLTLYEIRSSEEIKTLLISPVHNSSETTPSLSKSGSTASPTHTEVITKAFQDRNMVFKLLVCGLSWFVFDVALYGMELFGGNILSELESSDDVVDYSIREDLLSKQLIAVSMGIPACIASIYTLKAIGSKKLQILGFLVMMVTFLIFACLITPLKDNPDALYGIYCLILFSVNFGPILTTFILPSQVFPKEIRTTFNGIAAASGKLGAVIGSYMFSVIAAASSYSVVMILCAVLAACGAIGSYYYIDDKL